MKPGIIDYIGSVVRRHVLAELRQVYEVGRADREKRFPQQHQHNDYRGNDPDFTHGGISAFEHWVFLECNT
jgi:hypothetical protein